MKTSRALKPPRRLREGFAKAPRAPPFGNDSSDNDKPPHNKCARGHMYVKARVGVQASPSLWLFFGRVRSTLCEGYVSATDGWLLHFFQE